MHAHHGAADGSAPYATELLHAISRLGASTKRAGFGIDVRGEAFEQRRRRDVPAAVDEQLVVDPSVLDRRAAMPCGPAANTLVGVEPRVAQHAVQELLVGLVEVVGARSRASHRLVQRGEHPPHRSAIGDRRRRPVAWPAGRDSSAVSSASVMSARSSCPVAGSTWVAIAVSGFSATSTTASTSSVANAARRRAGCGKRGQRIAAGHEQRPDVARLDLVDERDRRDLPDHARKLGPARRRRRGSGAARLVRGAAAGG